MTSLMFVLNRKIPIPRNIHPILKKTFSKKSYPERVFSGIQPTGSIHLGNYFGAIKSWVDIQNKYPDVLFSIVDLHSITVPQDPKILQENVIKATATLIACGIDPEKSILFQQSMVSHHCELFWIFATLMNMGRLSHFPQFKEKTATLKEIPLGLYLYPVLQAADIMLYKTTHVPVGEDQLPHLQMTQHLIKSFNYKFGETFPNIKIIIGDSHSAKIKSLRDPFKKMSKSDPNPKSSIYLTDKPDVIREKCKKALTDFTSEVTYDTEKRPGVSNLISIHSLFTGKTIDEVVSEQKGLDSGKYKLILAEIIIEHLQPIQKEFEHLMKDPGNLINILKSGSERALNISEDTLNEVKLKIGIGFEQLIYKKEIHVYSN